MIIIYDYVSNHYSWSLTMSLVFTTRHIVNQLRLIPGDSRAVQNSEGCNANCKTCPRSKGPSTLDRSEAQSMKSGDDDPQQEVVQLEIGLDKLEALFDTGVLCAADVRCLNCSSKICIWNLCLAVCARRMQCNIAGSRQYESCGQHSEILSGGSSVHVALKREHLAYV
jgi:hypothetical protein